MPRRTEVVITGVGVVSPIGLDLDTFWQNLLAAHSGIGRLRRYAVPGLPIAFGGEVVDFDPKPFVTQRKSLKVMSRDIQFAMASAVMAAQQARIEPGTIDPDRIGVEFGAHTLPSELPDLEQSYRACASDGGFHFERWASHALAELNPLWMLKYLPNMPACHVAIAYDARGPSNSIVQGDVSSLLAIAEAVRTIERGHADVMICGGTASRVHPTLWTSSLLYDQISRCAGDPQAASRPFDLKRDGQVNGEGAAAFVLERRSFAEARGAAILAQVLGYGNGCDARRPADPPTGRGIQIAIASALRDSALSARDIGCVNAHGLSTTIDDRVEAQAIARSLGEVPVTANKSLFGNLGAGSGAVELAAAVLSLQHGLIPPTRNYECVDPECPIRVIHREPIRLARPNILSLNQTPGGQSVALVVGVER